jgi:hypothetical protein
MGYDSKGILVLNLKYEHAISFINLVKFIIKSVNYLMTTVKIERAFIHLRSHIHLYIIHMTEKPFLYSYHKCVPLNYSCFGRNLFMRSCWMLQTTGFHICKQITIDNCTWNLSLKFIEVRIFCYLMPVIGKNMISWF